MRPIFRRNFISRKKFQAKFVLTFMGMTALPGLATTAVFNAVVGAKIENLLYSFHLSPRSTGEILLPELVYTTATVIMLVIGSTCLSLRAIMRGISAPLFHMKRDLRRMAGGDISFQIALRTKDDFKDVATDLNAMASSVRDRFRKLEEGLNTVRESVINLDKFQNKGEAGIRHGEILLEELEELRQVLGRFKTG